MAAWCFVYQPGRWIAQVPRANSSASQSCVVRRHDLEPGDELVERRLHGGAVVEVDRGGIAPEADEQLAAVGQHAIAHEVAEGVSRA